MAAPNKQRIVNKLLSELGKTYADGLPEDYTVLDHLLLGVIQEDMSPTRAAGVYDRLRTGFHDFNEMRVSHPRELDRFLDGVPGRTTKSKRIVSILQFVFETTYTFDLESMKRKPLKQAQRQLSKIIGANSFTVAATVQRALDGHALPIDDCMCRVLARLQLIEPDGAPEKIRSGLEHLIPKAKGRAFCLLVGELAADTARQESLLAGILPKSALKTAKEAKPPVKKSKPVAKKTQKPDTARATVPAKKKK